MKKLFLILLIAPVLGFGQIGKIFPAEIFDVVFFGEGDSAHYEIPVGYVFQPLVDPRQGFTVYSSSTNEELINMDDGLVEGGYSVFEYGGSGVLFDFNDSDFELVFHIDEEFDNPIIIDVPQGKFLYVFSINSETMQNGSGEDILMPSGMSITLNSTNDYVYQDGSPIDTNYDGVIDESDIQKEIHFISGVLVDIEKFNNSLSANELQFIKSPTIYPNPTSSLLTLNSDKEYDIEVYDMAGNKVMALTGNTIDMSHLSSATYIVKALDKVENEEVSYKVVKN